MFGHIPASFDYSEVRVSVCLPYRTAFDSWLTVRISNDSVATTPIFAKVSEDEADHGSFLALFCGVMRNIALKATTNEKGANSHA